MAKEFKSAKEVVDKIYPSKPSRLSNIVFILGLVILIAAIVIRKFADDALQKRLGPYLLFTVCVVVLMISYENARKGSTRIGRYDRVYRAEKPFHFWALIVLQVMSMFVLASFVVYAMLLH